MLIEARILEGRGKLDGVIRKVAADCHVKTSRPPHFTLYGDFRAGNPSQIGNILAHIGRKYNGLEFLIDGVRMHEGATGYFVYFNIRPSSELEQFRQELVKQLAPIAPSTHSWDYGPNFLYHISIAIHKTEETANHILGYLNNPVQGRYRPLGTICLPLDVHRITLLGDNRRIRYEYDVPTKRLLGRTEALGLSTMRETYRAFRLQRGYELNNVKYSTTPKVFFISDLHFDHENIINYCARPFVGVSEMNGVLLRNWNNTVSQNDTVYFLGDMKGPKGRPTDYWLGLLNGIKYFVRGNHDTAGFISNGTEIPSGTLINHQTLMVSHDPVRPQNWDGWLIHGDKHNNDLRNYPAINISRKTINVSCEVTGYRPIESGILLRAIDKETTFSLWPT